MLDLTPHSQEAEQSIIGALLIDNNSIDRIIDINEDDFWSNANSIIFKAIKKQSTIGKQWDVVTIAEYLQNTGEINSIGGLAYLGHVAQSVPTSANIRRYSEIVKEHSARRKILEVSAELSSMITKRMPIEEAMNIVQANLLSITESNNLDEPKSISQVLNAQFDILERRLNNEHKGLTTGIPDLDKILNGGYHRGQVIILAARPSMGKTALSLHNAFKSALAGNKTLYLSMEMMISELVDRVLASFGRINLSNLLSGKMKEDEWEGVTTATSKLSEIPFHVLDKPGLTFFQVATFARRHKRKYGLDLLVVDYLQLMTGNSEDKRHSQIEEITRSMKVLAKELNIAILLLSQLSRKTEESRRPKLSHLRDSGSIEQDADVVLFIHREEMDNPETTWKNYADIFIAKNRQGALGRIGLAYFGEQVRFENYSGELPDYEKSTKVRSANDRF